MYLFILESIGTSELILIGIVALIIFGPRKLPQMAKTIGKMMAEFRGATNEFKTTWQREASFEEESNQIKNLFEEPEAVKNLQIEENSQKESSVKVFKPEIRRESGRPNSQAAKSALRAGKRLDDKDIRMGAMHP